MKKAILFVVMASAMCIAAKAQPSDSTSYKGFKKILHCHKKMTIICQPQEGGYIDSSQIKVKHIYTFTSSETFHTKTAYENYRETLTQNNVKTNVNVSASMEYEGVSGTIGAGIENDYMSKVVASSKSSGQSSIDYHKQTTDTFKVEYQSGKTIQLYECVVNVPGEYRRVYASPKVPDVTRIVKYNIVVDYNNAVKQLLSIIKNTNASGDTGEWEVFNGIARDAYLDYNPDKPANAWNRFLTRLKTQLWTDGNDRYSWIIVKDAANRALAQKNLAEQFIKFCQRFQDITNPSHNGNDWARINDLARTVN